VLNGALQCLTMMLYQIENCRGHGGGGNGEGRGGDNDGSTEDVGYGGGFKHYFDGGECRPNRDLTFCIAAVVLYVVTGWILCMSHKFGIGPGGDNDGSTGDPACFVDDGSDNRKKTLEVHTWSSTSEYESSNHGKGGDGILRMSEKCYMKIPTDGSTMVATVLVEHRTSSCSTTALGNDDTGRDYDGGKRKTTYSIQTDVLSA